MVEITHDDNIMMQDVKKVTFRIKEGKFYYLVSSYGNYDAIKLYELDLLTYKNRFLIFFFLWKSKKHEYLIDY